MSQRVFSRATKRALSICALLLTTRCSAPIGIASTSLNAWSTDTSPSQSCLLHTDATQSLPSEQALRSVVMIRVMRADGRPLLQGTGFVAADSAGDGTLKILTAGHVVGQASLAPQAYRIGIWLSDGSRVGDAQVLATGVRWNPAQENDLGQPDIAVLRIAAFQDARAEANYRQLPGLKLGPQSLPGQLLQARFSESSRNFFGLSGAPVIDAQGRVRGIMAKSEKPDMSLFGSNISAGWAEPIRAEAVVAQLGAAAEAVAPVSRSGFIAAVAGFPEENCSNLHASMVPTNRPVSNDLAQRLQFALQQIGKAHATN